MTDNPTPKKYRLTLRQEILPGQYTAQLLYAGDEFLGTIEEVLADAQAAKQLRAEVIELRNFKTRILEAVRR